MKSASSVISVLDGGDGESGTLEDMTSFVQGSQWYSTLTLDEILKFWTDGMIVHPENREFLTCKHCKPRQRFKEFQSADTLRSHFTTYGWHKHSAESPGMLQSTRDSGASASSTGEMPLDISDRDLEILCDPSPNGVWADPSDTSAQPGTATIPAIEDIEDTKTVCYDIVTGDCEAWLHAFVLVHIAVERRCVEWPEGCKHLAAVPRQFRSAMGYG